MIHKMNNYENLEQLGCSSNVKKKKHCTLIFFFVKLPEIDSELIIG